MNKECMLHKMRTSGLWCKGYCMDNFSVSVIHFIFLSLLFLLNQTYLQNIRAFFNQITHSPQLHDLHE